MSSLLTESLSQSAPDLSYRKRWTRAECDLLEARGLLDREKFELIQGDLIVKMPKKRPHSNAQTFILPWFQRIFGEWFVNTDLPIDLAPEDNPTSEPEPDIIILKRDSANFESTYPGPEDLHVVVEIANTSLTFDLAIKAALYARAGIVEYWVLDVARRRLIVHRKPESGRYTEITVYDEHESVAPLAAPNAEFQIASAFRTKTPAMM